MIKKIYNKIIQKFSITKKKRYNTLKINSETEKQIQALTENMDIEFIFSEWGEERVNAGGATLDNKNRLDPTLSSLKFFFPNAKYTLYADFDPEINGVETQIVSSPIKDKKNSRYGYHTVDYFKFYGLLNSKAEIACVLDTDMVVLNKLVYFLISYTRKFGACAPINARGSILNDITKGVDSYMINDGSGAAGTSYNNSPLTFLTKNKEARTYYETCASMMVEKPTRCPLVMSKAAWYTSFSPYILPPQWCLCEGYEGIGCEIILHIGHPSVAKFYNINN